MHPHNKEAAAPAGWTLRWAFGEVSVQALGGMLAPLTLVLPDGKTISPLQVAPWGVDNDPALPGVLRRLRGEWPCLPYGASKAPGNLPDGWSARAAEDAWDHGYTANHDWQLVSQTSEALVIAIDYPAGSAIQRLVRTVRPVPEAPAIEVELTIHARERVQLPLALHPTFAIPPSGVQITSATAARIYTYPVPTEPGVSRLLPNAAGHTLDAMPTVTGTQAFTRLPLPYATEELMQMVDCQPPFTLRYLEAQVEVQLDWDTDVLPDALIWISNAGRSHAPWSGRHYALGIEPMSGFFDLGRVVTPDPGHPLAAKQGVQLNPAQPLRVCYRISAASVPSPAKPRRLRLGMVGGGQGAFIGAVHRLAARLDDEYELVAAAPSSNPARALQSGLDMRLQPERIYTDFRAMARQEAARADGIDVVAIVVPNHLHFEVAQAFLEQGLHVLCDKPLTTRLADAQTLLALARQKNCLFGLTHNYSGYPLVRAARELVATGVLGELRIVQVEYAQDWLAQPLEASGNRQASWRTDPALAGPAGCLGDIGSHAAHLAEFVTGQVPSQISAELCTFVPGRRVDDHVQIQLRYASGARGLLWASQVACGEENGLRLRVYGSKAALRWCQESPNELWLTELGQPARRLTRGMACLPQPASDASRLPQGHPEGFIEAFAQLYRDFAQAVRQHPGQSGVPAAQNGVPGLEEGIRSLAFIEAAMRSSQQDAAWVALPVT